MSNNVAFIGGIHGVGKSTICRRICEELKIKYLSASELIRWSELNEDSKNKKVTDILLTQNRLIQGLRNHIEENKHYLLDGHYCLLNKENKVVKIPYETFELIQPNSLQLVVGEVTQIKARLESRDNKRYDLKLLQEMQDTEVDYATELSKRLSVELAIGEENSFSDIVELLKRKVSN